MIIDAYLRDKSNGKEAVYSYECPDTSVDLVNFMWSDGNWACDCNRLDFLYPEADPTGMLHGCGDDRIECLKVVRRDTGEVLYSGDAK